MGLFNKRKKKAPEPPAVAVVPEPPKPVRKLFAESEEIAGVAPIIAKLDRNVEKVEAVESAYQESARPAKKRLAEIKGQIVVLKNTAGKKVLGRLILSYSEKRGYNYEFYHSDFQLPYSEPRIAIRNLDTGQIVEYKSSAGSRLHLVTTLVPENLEPVQEVNDAIKKYFAMIRVRSEMRKSSKALTVRLSSMLTIPGYLKLAGVPEFVPAIGKWAPAGEKIVNLKGIKGGDGHYVSLEVIEVGCACATSITLKGPLQVQKVTRLEERMVLPEPVL